MLLETDTANRHVEGGIDRRYGRDGGGASGKGGKGDGGGKGDDGGEGGEGGRMFSTRDIVQVLTRGPHRADQSHRGGAHATVRMVDKTTGPFRVKGGAWVRAGPLERAIEGPRQEFFLNVAAFGSEAERGVVLLVWPATWLAHRTEVALLRMAVARARNASFSAWELPVALVKAAEGWEFAPRAKMRAQIATRFGAALNRALPGSVTLQPYGGGTPVALPGLPASTTSATASAAAAAFTAAAAATATTTAAATAAAAGEEKEAGNVNLAALRTAAYARTMQHAMMTLLRTLQPEDGELISTRTRLHGRHAALVDALLACTPDGGCLMRDGDGALREPELRSIPYDANAPPAARLARFDDEPWQLWDDPRRDDARGTAAVTETARALLLLHQHRNELLELLPPVLPCMGTLHKLGVRLQLRLACAAALAARRPRALGQATAAAARRDVVEVCRPELRNSRRFD